VANQGQAIAVAVLFVTLKSPLDPSGSSATVGGGVESHTGPSTLTVVVAWDFNPVTDGSSLQLPSMNSTLNV
jgi:hypothetical protein